MAKLGKAKQTTGDNKRYTLDYTDWCDAGETISTLEADIDNVTVPPLVVNNIVTATGGLLISYFMSGGDDGETYEVLFTASTSGGQTTQDIVQVTIKDG